MNQRISTHKSLQLTALQNITSVLLKWASNLLYSQDYFIISQKVKEEDLREPLKIAFITRTSEIFSALAEGQNRHRHSR